MKKYKYDIAISVAEEDLPAAQQIAVALRRQNISYYLYTEHKASNWGQHILKISQDAYGSEARYVLMLTSRVFVQKYWSNIESQISQIFSSGKEVSILQLRLDDTQVDGLSKYRVFVDWNSNPDEIADILKAKLQQHKVKPLPFGGGEGILTPGSMVRSKKGIVLLLIMICVIIGAGLLINRMSSGGAVNNTGGSENISKPYYYINVTGNNPDLQKMIFSYLKNSLKTQKIGVTGDSKKARKNIQLTFQETTSGEPDGSNMLNSGCTYNLVITDETGTSINTDSGSVNSNGNSRQDNLNKLAGQIAHKVNPLL